MNLRNILLTLVLLTPTIHADEVMVDPGENQTIIVLGDSLSAAYGIEPEQGWVNLLRERLQHYSQNTQWKVVNASVSGETTAGGLARLPTLVDEYQPSVCIIALGANDGLRGLSLKQMKNNLDLMLKACKLTGIGMLVGMQLPPNYGEQYTETFHQTFIRVAQDNQIELVPFLLEKIALEDNYFQTDRLHPTAEAQPLILETVWQVLNKVLQNQ